MELWYPGAIRRAGPAYKVYAGLNAVAGVTLHSMEGSIGGALTVLDGGRAASWCFSVQKNGLVQQHYPLNAATWHAGDAEWNARLVGIEHEGVAFDPLTAPQLKASLALVRWVARQGGWKPTRLPAASRTLWEHRETHQTQCPSGRIPWAAYLEDTVEADPLDFGETLALAEAVFAQFSAVAIDQSGGGAYRLTGPLPSVGGNPIAIPRGGGAYLIVLPTRAAGEGE